MDFDSNPPSHSAQVALYAMENRQAGHAAALPRCRNLTGSAGARALHYPTTGSTRATNGWAMNPTSHPTTYRDLPPEIFQRVADHMPFQDINNFATVDKRAYCALQERRLSWLCCERADNASMPDYTLMQQLMSEIERIRVEPALRAKPLRSLWTRVLRDLPNEQKPAAFLQVFDAAGRVPGQGLSIQKDMIRTLNGFLVLQIHALYKFVYADAERRSPEQGGTWADVASLLGRMYLDPPQLESEYRAFLGRLPALNASEQAELIVELAALLYKFRIGATLTDTTIAEFYEALFQCVQHLPASRQGAPIGALARNIWLLPDMHGQIQYAALRRLTLSLPDCQLGNALRYLPDAARVLPSDQYAAELSVLESVAQRVPPAQRAQAAIGLLESTPGLEVALSKQVWRCALRLLDGGDETNVLTVFSETETGQRNVLRLFPDQRWKDAKAEVRAFVERNRFSQKTRDALLNYIAQ